MDKVIISNAIEFVRNSFKDDHSGHDYFHTMRVYKMSMSIAEQENANLATVQLAALLHDVDDIKLSPETHADMSRANDFLRKHNISETMIEAICNIIDEVSFRAINEQI